MARILEHTNIQVMGILNTTPDSFSDGGRFSQSQSAIVHAEQMLEQGADIIDVGGESTRPGAKAVSVDDELNRVIPVVQALHKLGAKVSVDTSKATVMRAAIDAGADMINDVRALTEKHALETVVSSQVDVCLMHMQGQPREMQKSPQYGNVVREVSEFLTQRAQACIQAGIDRNRICLDPGFGFGKTLEHNCALMGQLERIVELGYPVLSGVSRKSMLGAITGKNVDERMLSSVTAATYSALKGAKIIRVHDVKETVEALQVITAFEEGGRYL